MGPLAHARPGELAELRTERMQLRRPGESDREDLFRMQSDPRVMATLGGVRSRSEADAIFEGMCGHWQEHEFGWWVARDPETGAFLGRGGLRNVRVGGGDEVEVGYAFRAEVWGRGLATELARASVRVGFEQLGLAELVSFTLTTNRASQRVMQKAGFRFERPVRYAALPHVLYRQAAPA